MTQHGLGWSRRFPILFLGFLLLGAMGCTRTATMSGTVKYKGERLTSGNVIFVDSQNRPSAPASIQPDGTYVITRVPVGLVTILINSPAPSPPETPESDDRPEWKAYRAEVSVHVAIPPRYMDLNESGKTFDVKSGDNLCDLDLD